MKKTTSLKERKGMRRFLFLLMMVFAAALMNAMPIITKWNTNAFNDGSNRIVISTVGAYTYTYVKADDSSVTGSGSGGSNVGSVSTTITFPQAGEYIVSITPSSTFKFYYNGSSNIIKLSELQQWGTTSWNVDLSTMFDRCSNLKITATDIPDFSNVTDMTGMFAECSSLTTVPGMNSWEVSNVTDMSSMFLGATTFNQNIENWNTSKVANMYNMFYNATAFNQNLGNWTLRSGVNLFSMFDNSGLSCENYSKTLKGWAENPNTPTGRNLEAIGLTYGTAGQTYRTQLVSNKGWIISGDSYDSTCTVDLSATDISRGEIALYPNPVKDLLNFSEEVSNIRITDASGKVVKQFPASVKSVKVSNLAKGNYIITATTRSGEMTSKKIIKD